MIYSILIGACVAIAALLIVWALAKLAFRLSLLVERWLSEAEKDEYFNIRYKPEYGSEFYRAHLVGRVDRYADKILYVVEIHHADAVAADAWAAPRPGLFGSQLMEKGKFYRYAFKEELYG